MGIIGSHVDFTSGGGADIKQNRRRQWHSSPHLRDRAFIEGQASQVCWC